MLAIRSRVGECRTVGEVVSLFEAEATDDLARQQRGRVRLEQLEQLAWAVANEPNGLAPDKEAARADIKSGLVLGVCMGTSSLYRASCDSELIETRLARPQLDAARILVLEDLESIFDFEMMLEGAMCLTLFLLERARVEMRFDDLRIALRVSQTVADGHAENPSAWSQVAPALLECLLEMDVFNEREILERLSMIRRIHHQLSPLMEAGDLPDSLAKLVQKAGDADRQSFSLTADYGPYRETVDRLDAAYGVTGNSAYLDDLVLYCEPARQDEPDEEAANRLDDLALFLRRRALCRGNTSDLLTAQKSQLRALQLTDEKHPNWRHYSNGMAASEYALMNVYSRSVADQIERLRVYLPTLPFDSEEDNLSAAADACVLSLTVELTAAAQHDEEAEKAALLQRTIVAGEEAHRLFEAIGNMEDARDMSLLAEALKGLLAAVRDGIHDEAKTGALVESLERTGRHTRFSTATLAIISWMLTVAPDSRDALIEALQNRYAARPIGVTSKQIFDYEVIRWMTCGVLWRGDIAAGDRRGRAFVSELVQELMRRAVGCGAADVARAASDTPLAISARVAGEAAVQLALAGECDEAAYLAQISVAVRANNALLSRVLREGTDGDALTPSQGESSSGLIAIVGWETTVVLLRLPGGDWELTARHPSETLTHLDHPDWVGEEHTAEGLLSLRRWLDRLGPVLCEALAASVLRAQAATDTPVLCLGMGCLSHYPLGLLAGHRPEVALPLPSTTGVLADETAQMLREPVNVRLCAFFAGASTASGTGAVDIDADLEAIQAAGLDAKILGAAEGRGDASVWPPPSSAEVLHYAGHLVPTGPDVTEMVLADGARIETYEIRGTDLRSLQVAVLMCCHSSSPRLAFSGEQIQHLAGAFLEAGTSAVVASLWPAFDIPARLFNQRFYEGLASGTDISACFSAAVHAIRMHRMDEMAPFAHPVFWAGFTLYVGVGSWIPARLPVVGPSVVGAKAEER